MPSLDGLSVIIAVATEVSICNYIDMEKNEILKIFGKNLRAGRNRAGYSQDELAEKMGICAGKHIGTIERGETKSISYNYHCCHAGFRYKF